MMDRCGYPNLNSYVKILCIGIPDGRTDRQMEGQTDREINPGGAG
jgi:hypothetical protein